MTMNPIAVQRGTSSRLASIRWDLASASSASRRLTTGRMEPAAESGSWPMKWQSFARKSCAVTLTATSGRISVGRSADAQGPS